MSGDEEFPVGCRVIPSAVEIGTVSGTLPKRVQVQWRDGYKSYCHPDTLTRIDTPSPAPESPAGDDLREAAPPYSIGSDRLAGLSKLIEECGEVMQVAGKLLATGGDPAHWDGSDLHARLADEMADVDAAIRFVATMNPVVDDAALNLRATQKYARFLDWHHEQGGAIPEIAAALATPAPPPAALPEGMTAERLRDIAGTLAGSGFPAMGERANRWADALDARPSPPEGLSPGPVVDGVQVPDGHEVVVLPSEDVDRWAADNAVMADVGRVLEAARAAVARRPPVEPPAPETTWVNALVSLVADSEVVSDYGVTFHAGWIEFDPDDGALVMRGRDMHGDVHTRRIVSESVEVLAMDDPS